MEKTARYTTAIHIAVTPEQKAQALKLCKLYGVNQNEFFRGLLDEKIKADKAILNASLFGDNHDHQA